jgi:hypothetical protein
VACPKRTPPRGSFSMTQGLLRMDRTRLLRHVQCTGGVARLRGWKSGHTAWRKPPLALAPVAPVAPMTPVAPVAPVALAAPALVAPAAVAAVAAASRGAVAENTHSISPPFVGPSTESSTWRTPVKPAPPLLRTQRDGPLSSASNPLVVWEVPFDSARAHFLSDRPGTDRGPWGCTEPVQTYGSSTARRRQCGRRGTIARSPVCRAGARHRTERERHGARADPHIVGSDRPRSNV